MTSRVPFYISIILLIIIGTYLIILRHSVYGVPYTPGETRQVWEIEALIQFNAQGEAVKVSLAAPETQDGFTLVNESTASPGYGVSYIQTPTGRRAEWSIRSASGVQTIYYKAQFLVDPQAKSVVLPPAKAQSTVTFTGPEQVAANTIYSLARERSSDDVSFARELFKELNNVENQHSQLLLNHMSTIDAAEKLFSLANIPNKVVGVLTLEDGRRRQHIELMNQIWDGKRWVMFDPNSGTQQGTHNKLVWDQSNISLLDVVGGNKSRVLFSMITREVTPQHATQQKIDADGLLNLSIHSLPLEEQAMFKTITLIPIGALIVVILRILVGLKTSGTFMPVLIAVAFVQTQLLPGIIGFLLIVGTGLIIRSYLSKLNLLLVARISAVIISVILIIALFTILAFKLGITEGLSITFFPMIILSWTVERMSILWEEDGAKEVLVQGGGSLLTAVLVYLAMTNSYVQHLTFNFIGIQLIILAAILLLGTYTGYRISELKRFKSMVN
jgi:hypothetical protein